MSEITMNHFALMARFNEWVNARLYASSAELSNEDYRRDRKAFFGSILNTLNHLLVVDRLWTGRIRGIDHGITSLEQILYDDFAALGAARVQEDRDLIAYVDGLDDDGLRETVTYKRTKGVQEHTTRRDHILLTLYNHQTHHRGQVHTMLTQAGVTPPALDVIYFLADLNQD